jgi:ornithine--oxo-acid transaminase
MFAKPRLPQGRPVSIVLASTRTRAIAVTHKDTSYQEHVNPQWVRLLDVLQMNARYTRSEGTELFTEDGRRILDFLSGSCVHNLGHNHPAVIDAIRDELDRRGPAMLQGHAPQLAGELADKLCWRAGGRMNKAFFCSSGSEGVEAAIKFSRAHTHRDGLLYAEGAFHGLTCGALSLIGDPFRREHFGPMLAGTEAVPFEDLAALELKLASKRFAAFIVEPLQSEGGIHVPPPAYLEGVQAACRRHGTLLVVDEVQTGFYRTGRFLASHHFNIEPDMIVLAGAISGGLIPSAALLMSDRVYDSVYGSIARAMVHTSTFGENSLALRAGLATLETLEREHLGERALAAGDYLRTRLRETLSGYEMVREVRGLGLLNGIEFQPPRKLALRLSFEAFGKIHPGMFGQVVMMQLFRHGFLTQMCGNNFQVLKVAPPLVVKEREADEFVHAVRDVVEIMHSSTAFWSEALGLAKRAVLK